MSLHFTEYVIDVWNNVNKMHLMNLKMKLAVTPFSDIGLCKRISLTTSMRTAECVAKNGQTNGTDRNY